METAGNEFEADNRTGVNHEGTAANRPVKRLSVTSIIGNTVENNDGEELGKIDDLMFNVNEGCIEYAILEFGSFLGMGGKLFAIPYKELVLDPLREIHILNRDKEYLKKAPGFDKEHWPNTNDHNHEYYKNVGDYWGSAVIVEPAPIAAPAPGSPLSAYY